MKVFYSLLPKSGEGSKIKVIRKLMKDKKSLIKKSYKILNNIVFYRLILSLK